MKRINIVSLGCFKNLVDTERLMAMLGKQEIDAEISDDPTLRADAVVINTCGFIGDAKEESINTILLAAQAKERRRVGQIYVMGCLSERYAADLPEQLPEVDGWYGKFDWHKIAEAVGGTPVDPEDPDRVITTAAHHAYVKISEGCNRYCAYCAIPLITGRMRSRRPEDIEREVRSLVARGVKEFNIIAQDLTGYGLDFPEKRHALPALIDRLACIPGVEWIRLHYAYPTDFPMELMDVMAAHPNVCNYLDIALQHISDPVLNNMRRHISGSQTRELLEQMRRRVPQLHLRTTMMVGFPGEGDKEFQELMDFVAETRFERLGAFAYCEEENTYAAKNFRDATPEEVKQARLDALMELQERISLDIQEQKIGQTLRVIVDREDPEFYVGRTQWDSPEVDPEVLIGKTRKLTPGQFVDVNITDALAFDLIGEAASL